MSNHITSNSNSNSINTNNNSNITDDSNNRSNIDDSSDNRSNSGADRVLPAWQGVQEWAPGTVRPPVLSCLFVFV